MHSHPDLVAVAICGGKVRFASLTVIPEDAELADSEAGFFDATDHMTENVGASDIHIVLMELK